MPRMLSGPLATAPCRSIPKSMRKALQYQCSRRRNNGPPDYCSTPYEDAARVIARGLRESQPPAALGGREIGEGVAVACISLSATLPETFSAKVRSALGRDV